MVVVAPAQGVSKTSDSCGAKAGFEQSQLLQLFAICNHSGDPEVPTPFHRHVPLQGLIVVVVGSIVVVRDEHAIGREVFSCVAGPAGSGQPHGSIQLFSV